MEIIARGLSLVAGLFLIWGAQGLDAPSPAPQTPSTPYAAIVEAPRPVSVPTTTTPPGARCPQWWGLAAEAGWHADSMPTLDYVIWRESRCNPAAHNTTLNRDGSTDIGLTQINDRSWCLPTRWYPGGYLQSVGVLSTVGCEQLFDPLTNLKAAKALYDYSQNTKGEGFQPWNL